MSLVSCVTGYEISTDGTVTASLQTEAGTFQETGTLLIGADGIHSAIRANAP